MPRGGALRKKSEPDALHHAADYVFSGNPHKSITNYKLRITNLFFSFVIRNL
jgi:hypothetical protein